jgi:hypothetical protein
MDPFSNAVFPFTVAATFAVITGFFQASRLSFDDNGDRICLQKLGLEPIPIMVLLTLIFGFFAAFGFSIRFFANATTQTGLICLISISFSLGLTFWTARATSKKSHHQSSQQI